MNKNVNTKRPKIVTVIPETSDEDSDMDDFVETSFHQPNPKYLGRKLQMRFKIKETGKYEWFDGQIFTSIPKLVNMMHFFSSDGQTIYINPTQEGDDIVFYK